jgi:hypothetical protein
VKKAIAQALLDVAGALKELRMFYILTLMEKWNVSLCPRGIVSLEHFTMTLFSLLYLNTQLQRTQGPGGQF